MNYNSTGSTALQRHGDMNAGMWICLGFGKADAL